MRVNHYFGMIDLLYAEQPKWSRSDSSDEIVDALLKISAKSGIDKGKAISCLEDQEKALSLVEKFQFYAEQDNIESTPTFIINGKKYTNRSYDELKKIIDKELETNFFNSKSSFLFFFKCNSISTEYIFF